jgi:predicted RNA-binding Zn-ribbon protein involved in translation (DUF1610 family)
MSDARQKTLFREDAESYQEKEFRTKAAGINTGLIILVLGLVGVGFFGIIKLISGSSRRADALPILIGLCAAVAALGLIVMVVNALRPVKTVTCPRCGAQHAIYRSEKKYMCPQCGALLLMGQTDTAAPQVSACPYCGLETAVTADHGSFLCPDCGIVRQPGAEGSWQPAGQCPQCHAALPVGAIFCKACGAVLANDLTRPAAAQPELKYDKDWQIGKSPRGHLVFARALTAGLIASRGNADPRQPYLEQLKKIQSLLEQLGEIMVHTEEALLAPESAGAAAAFLPEIDLAYAGLLEWKAAAVSGLMANPERQRQGFEGNVLCRIEDEPHRSARRRIEELLGDRVAQMGSIGHWEENLVQVQREEKVSQIRDFRKLTAESVRFQAWTVGYVKLRP